MSLETWLKNGWLDACRSKRNTAEYDSAGQISPEEAGELVHFSMELHRTVVAWLKANHPELL